MSRPYSTSQPLGRVMHDAGWTVSEVDGATGISYRTLSDYLAGRKKFSDYHLATLADLLDVDPDVLLGNVPIEEAPRRGW